MLDAPVTGGDVGAINATLSIMVGGKREAFDKVRPLFELLGRNIVYIGANGAGQVAKGCNQIAGAITVEAIAEALTLVRKNRCRSIEGARCAPRRLRAQPRAGAVRRAHDQPRLQAGLQGEAAPEGLAASGGGRRALNIALRNRR